MPDKTGLWTEEDYAFHRSGISGTDIAAICGLHPYKSALDVYAEKLNLMPPKAETKRMRLGRAGEPVAAQLFSEDHPDAMLVKPNPVRMADKPWMIGSPDYVTEWLDGHKEVLECKCTDPRFQREWEEGPPEYHVCQVDWYMALLAVDAARIKVLFGLQDDAEFQVQRSKEREGSLIEAGEKFWKEHVIPHVPPTPDSSESSAKVLQALYPANVLPVLPADERAKDLMQDLRAAQIGHKAADITETALVNQLKALIGEAAGIEFGGNRVTWKKDKDAVRPDFRTASERLFAIVCLNGLVDKGMTLERWITTQDLIDVKLGSRRFLTKWEDE